MTVRFEFQSTSVPLHLLLFAPYFLPCSSSLEDVLEPEPEEDSSSESSELLELLSLSRDVWLSNCPESGLPSGGTKVMGDCSLCFSLTLCVCACGACDPPALGLLVGVLPPSI